VSNLDQYSRRPGASSARRFVPPTTALALLFGGFPVQFGAGLFVFGMIFWWMFGAQSDATSWYRFSGDLARVRGSAVAVEDIGISEGGGEDSPGTPIYKVRYSFEPAEGGYVRGHCYGTGMHLAPGTPVDIEYVPGDPGTSRIVGSRKRPLDMWALFVAVFPGIGLTLMFFGLRSNARALQLLRVGKQARGRLVDKQPTNTKINNQMVYKLTFEYVDEAGQQHRISDKTHHTHLVEDEQTEHLFYNPRNPSEGKLVDVLPGRPKVEPDGSIGWAGVGSTAIRALLPVGGTAAHAAVGLLFYV
jgi:hypothetical protein